MDRPDLEPDLHRQALRGLATLNFLSRSVGILWPRIYRLARRLGRPVRILDLATGGGDVPLKLWRRAQEAGVQVDILGIDISPIALEVAQARAERAGAAAAIRTSLTCCMMICLAIMTLFSARFFCTTWTNMTRYRC